MDILKWRVEIARAPRDIMGGPGLQLALQLRCRVCDQCEVHTHAQPLSPQVVRNGYLTGMKDKSWFRSGISIGFRRESHCNACGTASIIPPAQWSALIELVDEIFDVESLRQAVESMAFSTERIPETDEYRAYDVYRGGLVESVTLVDWQQFALDSHRD